MTTRHGVPVQLDPEIPEPVERAAFLQASLEAWNDYQKTGLHLGHTATDEWLAKLEAGKAANMPECSN
jgi:predicted transcriptional regulator